MPSPSPSHVRHAHVFTCAERYRRQVAPNRNPMPTASASVVYGRVLSDSSMASTTLSPTSRTASTASWPLAPTSDITPSTFERARLQAAPPLDAKRSASWLPSRVTSLRSDSRSAWISPLAAEAALPLSRAASLASLTVSRTVSLNVPDVLDMSLLHATGAEYSLCR